MSGIFQVNSLPSSTGAEAEKHGRLFGQELNEINKTKNKNKKQTKKDTKFSIRLVLNKLLKMDG